LNAFMLRAAYGLDGPPVGEASARDLRAGEAVRRLLKELDRWRELDGPLSRDDVVAALERLELYPAREDAGRVAVVDLMRARTRGFDVAFLLGLEEGGFPRRCRSAPFMAGHLRRRRGSRPGARLP